MRYLPIAVFAVLVAFFAIGLGLNTREVPSPFVGKSAPPLHLPALHTGEDAVRAEQLRGRVWVLNVWASWCVGCRVEHALVQRLANEGAYIVGLNYKDAAADAKQWLEEWGNPYREIAVDASGATGLDWGVYGVPETFIIDAAGVVRHKHIGPLTEDDLREKIRPLLVTLREEAAAVTTASVDPTR